jgi:hypothetical protein
MAYPKQSSKRGSRFTYHRRPKPAPRIRRVRTRFEDALREIEDAAIDKVFHSIMNNLKL